MASNRHRRNHAPRVSALPTTCATPSNTSAITTGPNRLRACVIPLAVGTCHAASQQPNRDNDPVTFVATSV